MSGKFRKKSIQGDSYSNDFYTPSFSKKEQSNDKQTFHYSAIRGLEHSEILGDVWGLGFYSWKKNPSSVIPEVASRSVATTEVMQKPTHSRNGGLGFATS